jgi:tripartite-type tricarboxylate transporter receptor subunit TctC
MMHLAVLKAITAAAAMVAAFVLPAPPQAFPSKPVTLVVPWPAGGSADLAMRMFAEAAQKHLGQPVVN